MSKSKKRPTGRKADSAKPEESAPRAPGGSGDRAGGYAGRRPVLRFVVVFVLIMLPFSVFFYEFFTDWPIFEAYLNLNAKLSGAILDTLGYHVRVSGSSVVGPRSSLQIKHGCDAIFPSALFVAAVLASPVRLKPKIPGVLIGTVVLLSINLIRIVTLFFAGMYTPKWFHFLHVDFWQPLFIFLALFFWILWALRATRGNPQR